MQSLQILTPLINEYENHYFLLNYKLMHI